MTNELNQRLLNALGSDGIVRVSNTAAGSIVTGQVTVASTATQIAAERSARKGIVIINNGTSDVYIGTSGVTTSNGLLLLGVKGASIVMETTAAVYGIVASGTNDVTYMEIY